VSTLARSLPVARRGLAYDAVVVVCGSLVVAALAQVSVRLPFTPVPVTGQTLGVLLVGASLGATRGAASLLLYLAEGAAGLPVFAGGQSGIAYLVMADPLHATGGYLWGFVPAALIVGWLAQRGWDRALGSAMGAMLLGEIVIFACGVAWLSVALDVPVEAPGSTFNDALEFGLYPFAVGDVVKVLIAAGLLPAAWRLLGDEQRTRARRP
jgi:biotin transport system substrate-specific component